MLGVNEDAVVESAGSALESQVTAVVEEDDDEAEEDALVGAVAIVARITHAVKRRDRD